MNSFVQCDLCSLCNACMVAVRLKLFRVQCVRTFVRVCVCVPLTKEAIDDAEEAAHGADHRRDNFIAPLNLLVTIKETVSAPTSRRWSKLKGQQVGRGGHDDHVGDRVVGS